MVLHGAVLVRTKNKIQNHGHAHHIKDSRDGGAGVVLIAAALASAVVAPARGLNPCRNPGSFSPNASRIEFASNARTACGSLANTLDNYSSVAMHDPV